MSDEDFGLEEQERLMREMMKKEMIRKIEAKIAGGDNYMINKIKKLIKDDEESENEALKMKDYNTK